MVQEQLGIHMPAKMMTTNKIFPPPSPAAIMVPMNVLEHQQCKERGNARFLLGHAAKSPFGFSLMMEHQHTGKFEIADDHRAGNITVNLTGR